MKKIIIGLLAIIAIIGIVLGIYFNNQNIVEEPIEEEIVEEVIATPEPTIEPTPEPTIEPTPEPTPEVTEEPVETEIPEVGLDNLEIPDGFVAYTHVDGSFYLMEEDLTEDEMYNMAEYGNPYGESGVPEAPEVSETPEVSGGTSGSTPSEDDGNTTTVTPNTDTSTDTGSSSGSVDWDNATITEDGGITSGVIFGEGLSGFDF